MDSPPGGWNDTQSRMRATDMMMEEVQYDLSMDGMINRIGVMQNQMFLCGVLYGMALEGHKDRPLPERIPLR